MKGGNNAEIYLARSAYRDVVLFGYVRGKSTELLRSAELRTQPSEVPRELISQCGLCKMILSDFFSGLAHLHDSHNYIAELPPKDHWIIAGSHGPEPHFNHEGENRK